MHWDAKILFQKLTFYKSFVEKPKVEKASNIELQQELPFYNELSIVKIPMHLVDIQEVIKLK